MANVYALIEYLPIGATGAGAAGERVLSEHASWDGAVAAKQNLYGVRPELVGALTIRVQPATLKTKEGADGGAAAAGAGDGGDGLQGAGGGDRPSPDVPPLRAAGRGVPRRPVEPAVPGEVLPEAGDQSVEAGLPKP